MKNQTNDTHVYDEDGKFLGVRVNEPTDEEIVCAMSLIPRDGAEIILRDGDDDDYSILFDAEDCTLVKSGDEKTYVYDNDEMLGVLVKEPTEEEIVAAWWEDDITELVHPPGGGCLLIFDNEFSTLVKPGDEYPDGIAAPTDCDEELVT